MHGNRTIDLDIKTSGFGFHQHSLLLSSTNTTGNRGLMDTKTIEGLVNSISRFIHLVACKTMKTTPLQKNYRDMVSLLRNLKPVLDEVVGSSIPSDELLLKEFEELDMAVNEAREFMENWCPKMSKICSVLESEPLVMKVQSSSMEICHILNGLLQSSHFTSHLAYVQHCMQELQCAEQERTPELIEEALRDQRDNLMPSADLLIKIVESLSLTSNQELLAESMALEKKRLKAELKKNKGDVEYIDQVIDLVVHMRDCMVKLEQFKAINGIPIPSYFRCPLSLELMMDPVIVASGQTYERAFIQRWLDQGLKICPKTRQTLTHINLIPNYTVKALIANWCEDNNIKSFNSLESTNISNNISSRSLSNCAPEDNAHVDSFRGSLHSNSTSHSSLEVGNGSERQMTKSGVEDSNLVDKKVCYITCHQIPSDNASSKCNMSLEQSYSHSRSESTSSVVSSIEHAPAAVFTEVSKLSTRCDEISEVLGEVISECPASSPSNKDLGFSPWLSGNQFCSSLPRARTENGNGTHHRTRSSPFLDSDDLTTSSHVEKLVEDLRSRSSEVHTAAAAELRRLTKHNMENRIIIARCGAIAPLVALLNSMIKTTQENAVTALLNLSINDDNKTFIAEAGAIEPLIQVLKSGNAEAKENSAATLFSLSVLEEYKIKIGRSGAVKALVNLLGNGTLRGKKDAATALFNLSIFHENKARIVQAGAVKYLVELMDPDTGMADKAVALLANLATIPEGRAAITREGGIPLLVEIVESGSQRGKENAASALLQLCINSHKFCSLVLQEGAVPPLVALSQSGTPRAKEKAQQILSHFRNQREGSMGKVKS
ncbi:U-box domain-containing protein 3 [Magnolia sinica]|uniref:U-box domain-containing protein 3 n=1 Tax=Magnolia sinica TaxID=86752 RepID=UPI002658912E|nr:U-box domain-containing protein 3 [Magnolia sinica]